MGQREQQEPTSALGHIPALDGVRGVAILLVLLFHLTLFGPLPRAIAAHPGLEPLVVALLTGWTGVELFFVLSGFLITGILLRTRGRPRYWRTFFVRRVLRIFPAYYLALGLLFGLSLAGVASMQIDPDAAPWLFGYATNVRIALEGWRAIPMPLQHYWSLAIEEHFYLLWPLVVLALRRRAAIALCVALIVGGLAGRLALVVYGQPVVAYVATPVRLDALAAGGLLAYLAERGYVPGPAVRAALAMAGALAVAAIIARTGWLFLHEPFWAPSVGISAVVAMSAALVATCIPSAGRSSGVLVRAMEQPALRAVGRYSYGAYVWHQPLLIFLRRQDWPQSALGADAPLVWLALVWYLGASVIVAAVSWLSYHGVEVHFLRWKERWAPKTGAPRASAGPGD